MTRRRASPLLSCLVWVTVGLAALGALIHALSLIPAQVVGTVAGCLALALTVFFIHRLWGRKSKMAEGHSSPLARLEAIASEGRTSTDVESLRALLAELDVIKRQIADTQMQDRRNVDVRILDVTETRPFLRGVMQGMLGRGTLYDVERIQRVKLRRAKKTTMEYHEDLTHLARACSEAIKLRLAELSEN